MGEVKREKITSANVNNDSNSVSQFLRWLIFVLFGTDRTVLGLVSVRCASAAHVNSRKSGIFGKLHDMVGLCLNLLTISFVQSLSLSMLTLQVAKGLSTPQPPPNNHIIQLKMFSLTGVQ
jgi:hypothetical protein